MSGTTVRAGAKIDYSIIDEDVVVGEDAVIGADKSEAKGIAVLGRNIEVGKGAVVSAGAIIDKNIQAGEEA